MARRTDWIEVLEASYDLGGSDQGWLDNLSDCAEPLLDAGVGWDALTSQCTPTTFHLGHQSTRSPGLLTAIHRAAHAAAAM
jgi:hypothetical protein